VTLAAARSLDKKMVFLFSVFSTIVSRGLVHMHIHELKTCAFFLSCRAGLLGVDFYHAEDGDHEYALLVICASSCRIDR
jgi:hypothetical protein